MLSAEALRLSAIEILLPTAVQESGPYPTLAGPRVYDSRAVALEDLDQDGPYTPVLSLYTPESSVKLRGPHASADDTEAEAVLEIVAELAVKASGPADPNDPDGPLIEYADASAATDPKARLVLAALCAQVRRLLERSQEGGLWRTLVRQITNTDCKTFAVPEIGLRWHRVTIRMHCEIRDDEFDMEAGGLPEPIRSLYEALPDDSFAKEKLGVLAAHFDPELLPGLKKVAVTTGPVTSGPDDLSP